MKRLVTLLLVLLFWISTSPAEKGRLGIGFAVGEVANITVIPAPIYGPYVVYAITPAIHVGLQVGFLSGTSGASSDLSFDKLTTFEVSPYGKILLEGWKGFEPFFKLNISYINAKASLGLSSSSSSSQSENCTAIWGTVGLNYDVTKNLCMYGQVRLLDFGIAGKGKMTYFGLGIASIGAEFYF